jgi:hypothetical protein
VVDPAKIAKLTAALSDLRNLAQLERQAQSAGQKLAASLGHGANAPSASATAPNVAFSSAAPPAPGVEWGAADSALTTVRKQLFIPAAAAKTPSLQLQAERLAVQQESRAQALAVSLALIQSRNVASDGAAASGQALAAASLQDDLAAANGGRDRLLADLAGMRNLVGVWGGQLTSRALVNASLTSSAGVPSISAGADPMAVAAAPDDGGQALMAALQIHDDRVLAQSLLSQYPALRNTIASLRMAEGFEREADQAIGNALAAAQFDDPALISLSEQWLLAHDKTQWNDGSVKDQMAAQAASELADKMLVDRSVGSAQSVKAPLIQAFQSWLEADKQRRYWAELVPGANRTMTALDQQLGLLSDRNNVDVTSPAAAPVEQRALQKAEVASAQNTVMQALLQRLRADPKIAAMVAP